ncbi:hypothetical protein BP5796_05470 [Coleophoma crateriformis]|uniref:Uncharacterized protein n=1 Tax=Coleophoma crateriformis TaxID=565419 RepID=A0A3D8S3A1_9HELO|nr:hypothetical protein BP5796_05470 [Coleophoma crateriformis]
MALPVTAILLRPRPSSSGWLAVNANKAIHARRYQDGIRPPKTNGIKPEENTALEIAKAMENLAVCEASGEDRVGKQSTGTYLTELFWITLLWRIPVRSL